jgi:hypothetical protein
LQEQAGLPQILSGTMRNAGNQLVSTMKLASHGNQHHVGTLSKEAAVNTRGLKGRSHVRSGWLKVEMKRKTSL